jgi:hypothetical protein
MADSLSGAILFVSAVGVAGAVGAELVAKRGANRGAIGDYIVAGLAARVFTAGDDFHTGRCSPDNGSPPTIPRFFWIIAKTFSFTRWGSNQWGPTVSYLSIHIV